MLEKDNFKIIFIIISIIICFYFLNEKCFTLNKTQLSKNEMINTYIKENHAPNFALLKVANDTITSWLKNDLVASQMLLLDKWKIETPILINANNDKLYCVILKQSTSFLNSNSDWMFDLVGAKINGKWYFFFGSSTVIDRASYQDSIYNPMTFDELSYLARENLSRSFYQDEKGNVKVLESFFDFMDDPNGWGLPAGSTRKDIDSVIVARNKKMRQYKIDPAEIEQIKAEMAKSVRPKEPIPDLKWYEKIFPKEKKLFETDEWKEYVKSKNQIDHSSDFDFE